MSRRLTERAVTLIVRHCLHPHEHRSVEEILLRAVDARILGEFDRNNNMRMALSRALSAHESVVGWIVGSDPRYRRERIDDPATTPGYVWRPVDGREGQG